MCHLSSRITHLRENVWKTRSILVKIFWKSFIFLSEQIGGKVVVLMISETKLADSFPNGNFITHGYSSPLILETDSRWYNVICKESVNLTYLLWKTRKHEKFLIICSHNPKLTAWLDIKKKCCLQFLGLKSNKKKPMERFSIKVEYIFCK